MTMAILMLLLAIVNLGGLLVLLVVMAWDHVVGLVRPVRPVRQKGVTASGTGAGIVLARDQASVKQEIIVIE